MSGLAGEALALYAAHGAALIDRYDRVDSATVLAPVMAHFPGPPAPVADIGAGTGRDAAWLAALGYAVTAVEPTETLRSAGQAQHPGLSWRDAQLPELAGLASRGFDVVLLNAVWHHLDPADRDAALRRVTEILRPGGRAVVALRHGAEGQGVAALDTETEAARAAAAGFETLDRIDTGARVGEPASAGVTWTWLILEGART